MDMTKGPLAGNILRVAIPLALTDMLQQVFTAADMAVVGRFAGTQAMAAVGGNANVVFLVLCLVLGISLGSNVLISNYMGRRDEEGTKRSVETAMGLAILIGAGGLIIGELGAPWLLQIMQVPEDVMEMALLYIRIYFLGFPVISIYNFETAILRCGGDTKTPLLVLAISGVMNVGLNLLFVVGFGMDVDGVALGTVISNAFSAIVLYVVLRRSTGKIRIEGWSLGIDKGLLLRMVKIGFPASIQMATFAISNLFIQAAINGLGAAAIAASSAAGDIEMIIYLIISAFGSTATTFVGQNYGAGDMERCREVTRKVLWMGLIAPGILTVIAMFFLPELAGIFSKDPAVIELAVLRMKVLLPTQLLWIIMDDLSGSMRGYGESLLSAMVSVFAICGVRILWIYLVYPHFGTFWNLMILYPVSWVIASIGLYIMYQYVLKKAERRLMH